MKADQIINDLKKFRDHTSVGYGNKKIESKYIILLHNVWFAMEEFILKARLTC